MMSDGIHVDVSVPDPAEDLTATAVNSSALEVQWTHSGDGNVDVFKVWAVPEHDSSAKPAQPQIVTGSDGKKSYSTFLKDLTPGELYTVIVSAQTSEGFDGETSNSSVLARTSKWSRKRCFITLLYFLKLFTKYSTMFD